MKAKREITIGQGFPSANQPDKGRIATYRVFRALLTSRRANGDIPWRNNNPEFRNVRAWILRNKKSFPRTDKLGEVS